MCQNCKQKKLLQQKSVSAKKVNKRGDKNGKLMRRGDSIKKLRSGGHMMQSPIHGHRIVAVHPSISQQPTPANSIYSTVTTNVNNRIKKNSNSHSKLDEESMTMTHEDEDRDIVPTEVSRQQSHKQYVKRQYSSNNGMGEYSHHHGMPIAGVQSVGSSHYGMSSMNNSYNSYNNMQHPHYHQGQRGMNLVTNMAHFVAPRSLPAHNKLASNSVPPRHVIMANGAHIDLEYGTDPSGSGQGMGQDRFIADPDEDSLSMSDDINFGVHSPNTFTSRARKNNKRRQVKDSINSSVDSSNNNNNGNIHRVHVRGQESGSADIKRQQNPKMKKLKKESTETSVDDESEIQSVELKQEMLELKETRGINNNKSKKKKQRQRGQSAVRQIGVKGQEEDSNDNSQGTNSDDTDEEVTVSDGPISEIMDNLKRLQSVKHHSI